MAVCRITGPLLKANLLRNGVDLAFETDLLYLDVNNGRVGIKTSLPDYDLDVAGTTRSTNLTATTQADLATFTISSDTIASSNSVINLRPAGANPVVYQGKIVTGDLQISTNVIETTATNQDLNINTLGTGQVNVNANLYVDGDVHVTGNLQVDGDASGTVTIGDADTDNVEFKAEVNSNIIPDDNETWNLGSDPLSGGKRWNAVYTKDLLADQVIATTIEVDGIDLAQVQGNIYYVATTGSDTNAGEHEHNPFLTVKHALSVASAGDAIYIYPGTYAEIFPLTVPAGVSVKGAGIRSVKITPTSGTNDKDAFLLNGETTIEDLTVADFFYNVTNNTGYAFRFDTGMTVTTRSPYIRNCTVIAKGSITSSGDPYGFDANDAGKGVLADGSVVNAASKEASMLFHSVTFFTPNQECISATNGVRIEWLNSFTYFADKGLYGYGSSAGFAGAGLTRLRIESQTGTWAVGNTVTYYDTDGTTVLASGTIDSIDGDYVNLTGRCLGFETITDRVGKTVYAQGNAKLATAQKKFGTASLALDGVNSYASIAPQPDFNFGSADFTMECWVYPTAVPTAGQYAFVMGQSKAGVGNTSCGLYLGSSGGIIYLYSFGTFGTLPGAAVAQNAWSHIALTREGNNFKLWINGTQAGSTLVYSGAMTSATSTNFTVGGNAGYNLYVTGYIDDVKVSKGVCRYTGTFTAPTAALTGDLSTVLLLHFNGANNSTTFIDDGITLQDLRTSAGGTATLINFADFSDFGAELRSIGSACIYGNYGAYGDGAGVLMYLIGQNFAYVGSGKLSTNDPNDRIDANEVTKLNDAKIYYTSVDNEGNFSVGDAFFVNQETGDVLFNGQSLSITVPGGVTFTDGTNTTTITPTDVTTGNIRISGNTVESVTGDINVTAASGSINLQNNTYITGNLDVTGDITLGGNIQVGDASTDTINFVGGISSNLIPATTATYNLGSSSLRWANVYLNRAEIDGLVIDNNTIETTVGNDDLILQANGTGIVSIPNNNVEIDQNLTVTTDLTVSTGTTYLKNTNITGTVTQTGDIVQTGNFTSTGTLEITGNVELTGYLELPGINIRDNTISTRTSGTDLHLSANGTGDVLIEDLGIEGSTIKSTVTDADITLKPLGSGIVIIDSNQSLQLPNGTTLEQPAVPANGMIRYNSTINRYEGYNNGYWLTLGGVQDADGNTYISAELTPGTNDNIIRFYSDSNLMVTIDSTKLFAERLQTTNLDIQNNTITPITIDSDINLTPTGTGSVRFGNLAVKNNTITNVVSGAVTQFVQSGDGYVKIDGTNGVVFPSGTDSERPGAPVTGMMRYNTEQGLVEVYNGIIWTGVAGSSGGVTYAEASDIAIQYVLVLG